MRLNIRRSRFIAPVAALVVVGGLVGGPAVAAPAAPAADAGPVSRFWPLSGVDVEPGDVEFRGSVSQNGASSTGIDVVFAVDVSGSTSYPNGLDCNGNGTSNEYDDYNLDDDQGDVLDCEIAAVVSLVGELRAMEQANRRINVAIVPFGDGAASAAMTRGGAEFVAPGHHEPDPDHDGADELLSAVERVSTSLQRGGVQLFVPKDVGTGTDFDAAVSTSLDLLDGRGNSGWVFLLSDGQSSVSQSVLDRVRSGSERTKIRTFAVGAGTGGCADSDPLFVIAQASNDTCVPVEDPTALSTGIVDSAPAFIDKVEVEYGGSTRTATVDSIGNWSVTVPGVRAGTNQATVHVSYTDGTPPFSEVWRFSAASSFRQVSIGDSYSAGEGAEPYLGQSGSARDSDIRFLCHRSADSWPDQVFERQDPDGDLDFQACSGAVMRNLDTQQQAKTWRDSGRTVLNGLQLEHLTPDTDLVTVTIGGNDLGFAYVAKLCSEWGDCADRTLPGTGLSLERWMQIRLALMHNDLDSVYGAIRRRIGPDGTIVAATYPRLWGTGDQLCLGGTKADRQLMARAVNTYAAIMQVQAPKSDVVVADVRDRFAHGNGCTVDGLNPVLLGARATDLKGGMLEVSAASLHPNADGVRFYADAVTEALGARARSSAPGAAGAVSRHTALPAAAAPPVMRTALMVSTPRAGVRAAAAAAGDADDAVFDRIVDDPAGFLAAVPQSEAAAVSGTEFADLVVAKVQGPDSSTRQCDAVVSEELVPVKSQGFAPGSQATVTVSDVSSSGGSTVSRVVVTADADGLVETAVRAPAATDGQQFSVGIEGSAPGGATRLGLASLVGTRSADCRAAAAAAGALPDLPGTSTPPTASPRPPDPNVDPVPPTASARPANPNVDPVPPTASARPADPKIDPATPQTDPAAPVVLPIIAAPRRSVARLGHGLTLKMAAASAAPVSWSIRGALPRGVRFDAQHGWITGRPTTSGTFTVTVGATNTAGTASTPITIVVPPIQELIRVQRVPALHVGKAKVPVVITHLQKRERWTVRDGGHVVARGVAKRAGAVRTSMRLPVSEKDVVHRITVSGSRKVSDPATRAWTSFTVTTLAPVKRLTASVRSERTSAAVRVLRLAPGERVTVTEGRRAVAKGTADGAGVFRFTATRLAKGTHHLVARGLVRTRAVSFTAKIGAGTTSAGASPRFAALESPEDRRSEESPPVSGA